MLLRSSFLAVVVLALGCGDVVSSVDGGGDGDGDGDAGVDAAATGACDGTSIPLDSVLQCYSEAICGLFTQCQSFTPAFASEQECLDNFDDVFGFFRNSIEQLVAGANAGVISIDGEALAECLEFTDCNPSSDACDRAFVGLQGDGAACFVDFECGRGGECNTVGTGQCPMGTCTLPVGLNANCGGGIRCENGLQCVTDVTGAARCLVGNVGDACMSPFDCSSQNTCGPANTCIARVGDGATCSLQTDCVGPLTCVNSTCQRADAVGDPCSISCLGPLFCNVGTGQCEALPTIGQGCAASNRCLGVDAYCAPNNVCATTRALGESCDGPNPCHPSLFCDSLARTCAAKKADGQACDDEELECTSSVCEANVCEAFDVCYGT